MKNVAILTGGDSEERVISLQSAQVVYDHLPTDRYRSFQIDIAGADWKERSRGIQVDKNDFSLEVDGEKIHFDVVFAALHGSPMEDGKMQGYFDMLGIPYTCCNGFVSALTMNKQQTKNQLAPYSIPMAASVCLIKGGAVDMDMIRAMGLPLFVKPNAHGSSFGVTKVKSYEAFQEALDLVYEYDTEAVVEAFLPGREFANGALRVDGKVVVLPVTEIIPNGEYFDYAAKYEGDSQEITPADLTQEQEARCRELSGRMYEILNCQGVVRFDYILANDDFHVLEVNTIPGISPASLVPQQANAHGWELGAFFALLVEEVCKEN
jgi:D-alanine-D-alanine ligase